MKRFKLTNVEYDKEDYLELTEEQENLLFFLLKHDWLDTYANVREWDDPTFIRPVKGE